MEGHRQDNEETAPVVYRPYQPQSFDEDAEGAGRPSRPEPTAGDFEPQQLGAPGGATFEERPREEAAPETDFASLKFQRENTLLTNAESYAASIREEAQLYVRQLRSEVESLNKEAEERYAEAERLKAEAQAEAERTVAEAQGEVEQIREEARREGYEAGHAEGLQQRYEEAAPYLEQLEAVLDEMAQFRRRVAFYTEKDGVRLALLIAKKVLGAELKVNKQVVAKLVANTLAKLQGKGTFRIWVSQDDHAFMTAARPSLERFLDEEQALTLRAKPDLRPGNVLIETDREVIDLTFQSQFYHLEQQLSQTLAERESTLLSRRSGGSSGPSAGGPAGKRTGAAQPRSGSPQGGTARPAAAAEPRQGAQPEPSDDGA